MRTFLIGLTVLIALSVSVTANAAESIRIAWTHYTGWEPWGEISDSGLGNKHMVKECGAGSSVEISMLNDYVESINQYTAGAFDGVTATNMDALTIPAVGGVKSEMTIVGDTSWGNDVIVTNDPTVKSIADLKGKTVHLVELSVSHYMLARALDQNGLSERDVAVVNVSDADIGSMFLSQKNLTIVTWNPIAMQVVNSAKNAKVLFTSKEIEGEIIDALVMNANVASCAKIALRKAWYETVARIKVKDANLLAVLAKQSGAGSVDEFNAQIKTTKFYWTAKEADAFVKSGTVKETMDWVRRFSFEKGLFGNARSVDDIGIQFPDGSVMGNRRNTNLIFTEM